MAKNTNNNLEVLIKNSRLTESEKSFWIKRVEVSSDTEKEAYLSLFRYYPDDTKWVAETLMKAGEAFKGKNLEEFKEIKNKANKKLQDLLNKC